MAIAIRFMVILPVQIKKAKKNGAPPQGWGAALF
jgi:hypothetical protein